MDRKPIMPTLRQMAVGDVAHFPLAQYNSVRTSIYTSLLPERAEGMEWEVTPDLVNKRVTVTRTQ